MFRFTRVFVVSKFSAATASTLLRYSTMPPKRKSNGTETTTKKKSKVWEPFDPSVPNNTTMPSEMSFSKAPEGGVKIASYNVSGLRASIKKGFYDYVKAEDADILCIQETKVNAAMPDVIDKEQYEYHYWAFDDKKGYCK